MVDAVEDYFTGATQDRASFVVEALDARKEFEHAGLAYDADDVFEYLLRRAKGKHPVCAHTQAVVRLALSARAQSNLVRISEFYAREDPALAARVVAYIRSFLNKLASNWPARG